MTRRKRRLWLRQQDLRAMGAGPSLMAHRVGSDGRAEVRQLTADTRSRAPFGPEGDVQTLAKQRL
jgi:hypothetical protein